MPASDIGDELRKLREARGLSRRELAEKAGISESAIARLETGKSSPTIFTISNISAILGAVLSLNLTQSLGQRPVDIRLSSKSIPRIKVLVIDPQPLITQALAMALSTFPDLEVMYARGETGLVATGQEAAVWASRIRPDIVLLEYWMPVMAAPATIQAILERASASKVLVLSWFYGATQIKAALEAGAVGFLPKSLEIDQLADAIRRAYEGEPIPYGAELATILGKIKERGKRIEDVRSRFLALTPKELNVLRLLAYGLPMKEAASRLSISQSTLRLHIQRILEKTQTRSRAEAVFRARESGLMET